MRIHIHGFAFDDEFLQLIHEEVYGCCEGKKGEPIAIVASHSGDSDGDNDCIDINVVFKRYTLQTELGFDEMDVFHACVRGYAAWCQLRSVRPLQCAFSCVSGIGVT